MRTVTSTEPEEISKDLPDTAAPVVDTSVTPFEYVDWNYNDDSGDDPIFSDWKPDVPSNKKPVKKVSKPIKAGKATKRSARK